jgi:hypothetical protein
MYRALVVAAKISCIEIPALALLLTATRDAQQRSYLPSMSWMAIEWRNKARRLLVAAAGNTHPD